MHTDERIAIVTGGASGLGLSVTEKFIAQGVRTIMIGRDSRKLHEAAERLGSLCVVKQFDLTELKRIPSLVEEIIAGYGHIDILVNNAGIHMKKAMMEVSDGEFEKVIATNLTAVFSISREVGKVMMARGSGSILMISSMAAKYGIPQVIAYTAAKSGVEGMTRAMAVEMSPSGVRVNCIAPGFITTAMSSGAMNDDPERKRKALSRTPMGAFGKPEDVAEAAWFLVSGQARYITGAVLPVDGGNSIGF